MRGRHRRHGADEIRVALPGNELGHHPDQNLVAVPEPAAQPGPVRLGENVQIHAVVDHAQALGSAPQRDEPGLDRARYDDDARGQGREHPVPAPVRISHPHVPHHRHSGQASGHAGIEHAARAIGVDQVDLLVPNQPAQGPGRSGHGCQPARSQRRLGHHPHGNAAAPDRVGHAALVRTDTEGGE